MYKILITCVDGSVLEYEAPTVAESLVKFKPELIKGKVVIEARKDERLVTKVINVPTARRMFYNPLALEIFARNVERSLT